MKYIKILLITIFLFVQLGCISQKSSNVPIEKQEQLLVDIYNKFYENRHDYGSSFGEARDTILIRFREKFQEVLNVEEALHYSFPLLSKKVDTVSSEDKKLRIFSWDELNGGSSHIFNSLYQYNKGNTLAVGYLTDLSVSNQSIFLEISYYQIIGLDQNKYLVFGYGTHGGGQEFYTIRLLNFTDDVVSDCDQCFNGDDQLVFTKPRSAKVRPIFDNKSKTLRFPEFKEDEETGFLYKTNDTVVFEYKKGSFIKR